jgi:periplasmic divalent cation tolerance protein
MIVFSTAPSDEVARRIAREVVSTNLAACVNILPSVVSVYEWEGSMEEADEVLMIIKTSRDRVEELTEKLVSLHPYKVPEVIALPIENGHGKYLDWVRAMTRGESIQGREDRKK